MHGTSHWLGLDVHDAGVYKNGEDSVPLQEGMVFTVEPGLYFGSQAEDVPEYLRGIGIRIEDDVVVTATGIASCPPQSPRSPTTSKASSVRLPARGAGRDNWALF